MAKRSPTQHHNYWGVFPSSADLPNVTGAGVQSAQLEVGDVAYVESGGLYQCDDETGDAAVWTQVGGGGVGGLSAHAIIVGNAPAGDTVLNCHYLDTGNGAQLAAAIAAAATGPRDVYVRPGTYNLGSVDAPANPFTVGAGVRVRGAGRKLTEIRTKAAGGLGGAFYLHGAGAVLEDLRVFCPAPTVAQTVGVYGIIEIDAGDCELHRVEVEFDNYWVAATPANVKIDTGVYIYTIPGTRLKFSDVRVLKVPRLKDEVGGHWMYGVYMDDIARVEFRDTEVDGGDYSIYKEDVPWFTMEGFRATGFHYYGYYTEDEGSSNMADGYVESDGTVSSIGLCFMNTKGFTLSDIGFFGDGHVALWVGGNASRGLIKGCHGGGGWDEGLGAAFLFLDTFVTDTVALCCAANGDGYIYNGTGNDLAHNK